MSAPSDEEYREALTSIFSLHAQGWTVAAIAELLRLSPFFVAGVLREEAALQAWKRRLEAERASATLN